MVTHPGRWLSFLAPLLALTLVGCAAAVASTPASREPEGGRPSPALAPVRLAVTESHGGNVALWIAHANGLFRKYGVESVLAETPDRAAFSALAAGDVDVVVGHGGAVLAAAATGTSLRVVAGLVNTFPHRLMVDGAVEGLADLRGARLGASRAGTPSDLALRHALDELDLDPTRDVVLVQIGSAAERQAALENGAIQGAAVVPPESVALARLGFRTLVDLAAQGIAMPTTQVVVTERMVREQPALVQTVVNALVEGAALARRDRALAKRVLAEYLHTLDETALDATYELFVQQAAPRVPTPDLAGLRRIQPLVAESEPRVATLDVAALVAPHFVARAVEQGLDR